MQQLTPKITWVEGLSRQGFRHEKLLNKQNKQTIQLVVRAEEETPFWSKAHQASNQRLRLHNQLDNFKAASRKQGSGTWLRTALTGRNGLRLGGGRLAGGGGSGQSGMACPDWRSRVYIVPIQSLTGRPVKNRQNIILICV